MVKGRDQEDLIILLGEKILLIWGWAVVGPNETAMVVGREAGVSFMAIWKPRNIPFHQLGC